MQENLIRMNKLLSGESICNDNILKKRFKTIIGNPPFSEKWSADKKLLDDERFNGNLAPKTKADYAFIQHMIYQLDNKGTMAVVLPNGVLFRGRAEGNIRQKLVDEDLIQAIIGLPTNLFYKTGIPIVIIIYNKNKKETQRNKILFIDASKDFKKEKNKNVLRDEDIEKIVSTFDNYEEVEKYSRIVTLDEIKENEYNLNISRYIYIAEKAQIDMTQIIKELKQLELERNEIEVTIYGLLNETSVDYITLEKQQKMISIIPSIDAVIEKTEQAIAKTEKIKKGLMQQLLTKGIDHTEFKQTEMGKIPIEWNIMNLGELVKLQGGYAFKSTDYCLDGIQLIRISNLFGKYLNLEKKPVFLPIEYKDKYSQYLLKYGDLIICMTGTVGKEDYGHTVLIQNNNAEYLLNQRVGKFNLITENIDKDYLYWFLSSRIFLDYIYSLGNGTKQANLSAKQVESAKIALPNLTEQKKIVKILNKVNEKIIYDVEKVNKLKETKQGFIQSGQINYE